MCTKFQLIQRPAGPWVFHNLQKTHNMTLSKTLLVFYFNFSLKIQINKPNNKETNRGIEIGFTQINPERKTLFLLDKHPKPSNKKQS